MSAALVVIAFALDAISAPTATVTIDLATCIHRALERDPQAAAELKVAHGRLEQAQAGRFGTPEIREIFGMVNRARGNVLFSPDSKNDVFEGLGPFTRFELSIKIPIFAFGRMAATIDAAELAMESTEAKNHARQLDVVLEVKRLYYQNILSKQLALVVRDVLTSTDDALKTTEERLANHDPNTTETDLLNMRVGRAKIAKGLFELESTVEVTKSALARTIGAAGDSNLQPVDQKLVVPAIDFDALEAYVQEAKAKRPEARALVLAVASARRRVDQEQSQYYPSLNLATGFQFARAPNRDEQENPFAYDEFNYIRPVALMALDWNLNFWMTAGKVHAAEGELSKLEGQLEDAVSGFDLEVRRSYLAVEQAKKTVEATDDGSSAGRALMVSALSSFELGIGEAEALYDAFEKYIESRADHLRAIFDYQMAAAELSRAIGRELMPIQY